MPLLPLWDLMAYSKMKIT